MAIAGSALIILHSLESGMEAALAGLINRETLYLWGVHGGRGHVV